jgi:hypothetical protein
LNVIVWFRGLESPHGEVGRQEEPDEVGEEASEAVREIEEIVSSDLAAKRG